MKYGPKEQHKTIESVAIWCKENGYVIGFIQPYYPMTVCSTGKKPQYYLGGIDGAEYIDCDDYKIEEGNCVIFKIQE